MGNLYDLFTKKKIEKSKPLTYNARIKECLRNIESVGKCECEYCVDKKILSNRLFDITRYLCKDYTDKTGKELYVADALEIVLTVAGKIKTDILNRK